MYPRAWGLSALADHNPGAMCPQTTKEDNSKGFTCGYRLLMLTNVAGLEGRCLPQLLFAVEFLMYVMLF